MPLRRWLTTLSLTTASRRLPDSTPATAATATLAGLMPHSATITHWTLAPAFDAGTLAYAFDASNDTFVPVAELGFAGQTVFWKHGSAAYVGMAPVITLEAAARTSSPSR